MQLPLLHTYYMPRPSPKFDRPINIWAGVHISKLLVFSTPLLPRST